MAEQLTGSPRVREQILAGLDAAVLGATRTANDMTAGDALFDRLSAALRAPMNLKGVLRMIAQRVVDEIGCDHCSVFLLDGRALYPAVAASKQPSEPLWAAFRSMGPIDVDPEWWPLLGDGDPVVVDEVTASQLVPAVWVERFPIRSLALLALCPGGEPAGVLAADWVKPRELTDDEVEKLRVLGAHAGMCLGYAHPFEQVSRRAHFNEALARAAAALAAPLGPVEIVRRVAEAYADLLGAQCCAAAMVDFDRFLLTSVASHKTLSLPSTISLDDVPERIVTRLSAGWREVNDLMDFGDDPWLADLVGGRERGVTSYLVCPLTAHGRPRGGVVLGFTRHPRIDDDARAAAVALGALGASAFERYQLVDELSRNLSRLHILQGASAALTEGADARALVASLNRLLADHELEVVGVALRSRKLRRHLGAEAPTPSERESWSNGRRPVPLADGSLGVPMCLDGEVTGSLRVRPNDLINEDVAFVEALGAGLAEVARRSALRAAVHQAEREQAIAGERELFAADLQDTAGQLFVALKLLTARLHETLPVGSEWADEVAKIGALASQGKDEITRAIQALAFVPGGEGRLHESLEALVEKFSVDSGIDARLTVAGRQRSLGAKVERALYRVAHEALAGAWRHPGCRTAEVRLEFEAPAVVLRIEHDGDALSDSEKGEWGTGTSNMRRAVADVGGTLEMWERGDVGVVVEAKCGRNGGRVASEQGNEAPAPKHS